MIDERQTYKGLTLEILITVTERITHTNERGEQILWHETTCDDAEGPSMEGMRDMVDYWESEGKLDNLPNARLDRSEAADRKDDEIHKANDRLHGREGSESE